MAYAKVVLDTNVVIDYLNEREPFYKDARLLMIAGRVGELELCITSSQITDLIYILSDGGKQSQIPSTLKRLRGLRTFIRVLSITSHEIDQMLATSWKDPEDALLCEAALNIKADAIITRNQKDFESSLIKAMNCTEFFDWLKTKHDIDYSIIEF